MQFAEADHRFLSQLRSQGFAPTVVYDIGASNGYWSVSIADALPDSRYHLFEPLAETNPDYKGLLDTALAQHSNFTLHPIGLGHRTREQSIAIYGDEAFGSSFVRAWPVYAVNRLRGRPVPRMQRVPVHRLDDYIAAHGLPLPDVMKLDVQGYELNILDGGRGALDHAQVVLLECWLKRGYGRGTPLLHETCSWMAKRGFDLVDLGETFHGDRHELSAIDAYFMHRRVSAQKRYSWTIWR